MQTQMFSGIIKSTVLICLFLVTISSCRQNNQNNSQASLGLEQSSDPFQLVDLHVHLKGDLTIEEAVKKSKRDNVKYGIAVNCGLGFPIEEDSDVDDFVEEMTNYPQFYTAMQAEGREWVELFSEESMNKFDYVFTDAMTFTDSKGRRNRIWIPSETWVEDEQLFMDYLVNTIVDILQKEPIDIYVNATYLPDEINERYDQLWTESRMDMVIKAAKENDIAIEISNRFEIPSAKFISKAKKAGIKFTSGTNNIDKNFPRPEYTLEMIEKCGLTESDFWLPKKQL